jgi:hypothetical protein
MSRAAASESDIEGLERRPDIMAVVGRMMKILGPLNRGQRVKALKALLALVEEGDGG